MSLITELPLARKTSALFRSYRPKLSESSQSSRWFVRVMALITVLILAQHLFMAAYPFPLSGDDGRNHAEFLDEFTRLRAEGLSYPRWLPLANGGFGSTSFYYYPPLAYALASLIRSVTGLSDPTSLFQAVNVVAIVVGIAGLFLYLRRLGFKVGTSLIAATLFAVAPYTMGTVFLRNALAERTAYMWFPWLFLSIEYSLDARDRNRFFAIISSAMPWAGIVLTNIPATLLLAVVLPVYALIRSGLRNMLGLWPSLAGLAVAAMCSAIYWWPVLHFRKFMSVQHIFDFIDSRNPWSHFALEFVVKSRPASGMLILQAITAACTALALGYLWRRAMREPVAAEPPRRARVAKAWSAVAAVVLFLQIPYVSDPIWQLITPLHLIQFSFRFLCIGTVIIGVATAYVLEDAENRVASALTGLYAIFGCLWTARYLVIVLTFPWPPPIIRAPRASPPEHVPIFAATKDPLVIKAFARDHANNPAAWFTAPTAQQTGHILLTHSSAVERRYHVDLDQTDTAVFHQFYWPQWKLYRGATEYPAFPGRRGLMSAQLPAGSYDLDLRLERSASEDQGAWISTAGLGILVILDALGVREKMRTNSAKRIG